VVQFIQEQSEKLKNPQKASPALLAHLRREPFHAVWKLLDEEFRDAYLNGIVVVCGDGVRRHIYLHFVSYSADYPEK
jgi:hypothetical protein